MRFKIMLLFIIVCIVMYSLLVAFIFPVSSTENHLPEVRIIHPKNDIRFQWNAIIPYSITVSDAEDGNSEYDEIAANEVLLKVAYLPDSSEVIKYIAQEKKQTAEFAGLYLMQSITCFNCHSTKNKLIGPSYDLIAKKYAYNNANIEALAKKVISGSEKVWGDVIMPPNTNINIEQAKQMVRWILKNNTNPDKYFITGTTGTFTTKLKPPNGANNSSVYVLTASYTDHGINNAAQSKKRGYSFVVLKQ